MVEEILRVENLCKKFENMTVIDDVTISFYRNEIFRLGILDNLLRGIHSAVSETDVSYEK